MSLDTEYSAFSARTSGILTMCSLRWRVFCVWLVSSRILLFYPTRYVLEKQNRRKEIWEKNDKDDEKDEGGDDS